MSDIKIKLTCDHLGLDGCRTPCSRSVPHLRNQYCKPWRCPLVGCNVNCVEIFDEAGFDAKRILTNAFPGIPK